MFRTAALLLGSLLLASLPAAAAAETALVRAHVTFPDKAHRSRALAEGLDLERVRGLEADAYVTPAQLEGLRADGCRVDVVAEYPAPGPGRAPATTPEFLPQYYTYAEAVAKLNALAAAYPALTSLEDLGNSIEGRDILALKISDNAAVDEDEPEVLVMGCHHSREAISVIVPLALADSLLLNYGTNPQFTQWVDEREIWVLPVVNPDGLVHCENTYYFWRKNRRGGYGVDLNRNYAFEWGHDNIGSSGSTSNETYRGASPASEPEVQAIQSFVDSRQFVFSLSFHSYGDWLLWGPGYKPAHPEDQDVFRGYGDLVAPVNGFEPGNPASSTIYTTNGSSDDWLYNALSHAKVFALTPEVGTSGFNPPAAEIPSLTIDGLACIWPALEHADRPTRLAPPGPPALDVLPVDGDGAYDVTWSAPTLADTEPVEYEIVEKTGPVILTDGFESGAGNFATGGFATSTVRKYAGSFSLFSGGGNAVDRICWSKEAYTVQPGDSFTFRAWWDLESGWDYAYVVLSTDGGRSFVPLPGSFTTMSDPNSRNADNGITGTSSGVFQPMSFSLAAWEGQSVRLGFRFNADEAVGSAGIYIDEVAPVRAFTTTTTLSSAVAGTSFPVASRPDGVYHYAVRGRDAEGDWGYWSDDVPVTVELSTGVEIAGPAHAFRLAAAAPTPFADRTELRFSLPVRGDHSLTVYDVGGRRVRRLSSGPAEAGAHAVVWDGRDDEGRVVPAGVYFYTLRTDRGELRQRTVRLN